MQVIHLRDCPDVVRRYLETGDESIRDAARTAACDAACDAAWATTTAARTAWDAWDAKDAARAAARDAQNNKLTAMLTTLAPEDYREAV
jgi:hypothetical protein